MITTQTLNIRDATFQAMEELPKEAYVTCCGNHATLQVGTKNGGERHE